MLAVKQFIRFLGVGGVATAIQYFILVLLVAGKNVEPVIASTVGFLVSSLVNYELNHRFTFSSTRLRKETLPLFYLVVGFGLILNAFIIWFCVSVLLVHYFLSQLTATGAVLISNFALNKLVVFRR
jgi:putative flippase GtrA